MICAVSQTRPAAFLPVRRSDLVAASLAALAAFLPFARGILGGASLYFRDLSLQFFPVRQYVAEGLRQGQLRFWNPYAYEGAPLWPPPVAYLPDLLQALRPEVPFFSLLLVAHIPFAALSCYALARRLGSAPVGAAASAIVFSLGGFALSTVNLYVYAQALPWVPLLLLAMLAVADGGRREVALAAACGAALLSTFAIEFAAQAVAIGLVLVPVTRRSLLRLAAAGALAVGLCALALLPAWSVVASSARGSGFPTEVVLAHSVHPIALAQVVVGGLFGDPSRFAERFWGMSFFPRGFPYLLSLYLGATTLALGCAGVSTGNRFSRRLASLALISVAVCLGRWVGWAPVIEAVEPLHVVRFPVKAFLTAHLAAAILAGFGVDALTREPRRPARAFVIAAGLAGLLLIVGPTLLLSVRPLGARFLLGFFPPGLSWDVRVAAATSIRADSAQGGLLALVAATLCLLGLRAKLRPALLGAGLTVLLAVDLLRHGAGLNPMASPDLLAPSAEVASLADHLREHGQRLVPLEPSYGAAYFAARQLRGANHELWTLAVIQDTLSPDTNLSSRVPTALTPDRTMLVPSDRIVSPEEATPAALAAMLPRLRAAAVSHLLSIDRIDSPSLVLQQTLAPVRIAPLELNLYRLRDPVPIFASCSLDGTCRTVAAARHGDAIEVRTDISEPSRLIVREAYAAGWTARVDGRAAPIARIETRYMAVHLPAGSHRLRLEYSPPGWRLGLVLSGAAGVFALAMLLTSVFAMPGSRDR